MEELRRLADQGDAQAQFELGFKYAHGQGVSRDDQEAVRWFRLAAEQGFAKAQYNLGFRYVVGKGVPRDFVLSHMWVNLSAAQGLESASEMRDHFETAMTPDRLAEAQRLAREWTVKGK